MKDLANNFGKSTASADNANLKDLVVELKRASDAVVAHMRAQTEAGDDLLELASQISNTVHHFGVKALGGIPYAAAIIASRPQHK